MTLSISFLTPLSICRKPALQLYLQAGHKIGKPVPLFAKIEQARLDELKKKYGGSQQTDASNNAKKPEAAPALTSVKDAEAAVAAQGEKVRALKSSGAEKAIVTAEVAVLLALKKQLAALQVAPPSAPSLVNGATEASDASSTIAAITAQIDAQGEKVRKLKAAGSEKSVWQPEVDRLLELKKALVAAGGTPAAAPQSSSKNKKKK